MKIPVNLEDYFQKTLEQRCLMIVYPKYKGYEHINNEKLYYFNFQDQIYLKEDDKFFVLTENDIPMFLKIESVYEKLHKERSLHHSRIMEMYKELIKIPEWIRKLYKTQIPSWLCISKGKY